MIETEKRNTRFSKCRIDEQVNKLKKEVKKMIHDQTMGVAESESRIRQELKAESERMKEFKDQITNLAATNTDGAEGVVGIDSAAEQFIRSNLNDLKKEMEDVKQKASLSKTN